MGEFPYLWRVNSQLKQKQKMLDIQRIREDFPILDHQIYGKPLIYFDNSATTQKPREVVEKIEVVFS